MREFFSGSWASGLLIAAIMLIVYVVHGGQQFTNHDDRILYNSEQIKELRQELKEFELGFVEQSKLITEVRLDFVKIETRLDNMDAKLDKLLANDER